VGKMKFSIQSRSGKTLAEVDVANEATVRDLKRAFAKAKPQFYPDRQRFSISNGSSAVVLDDDSKELKAYGLKGGETLLFKDLGPQIGWRTVFIIEYLGPIVFYCFFYLRPDFIYGKGAALKPYHPVQQIAFYLFVAHFIKRELETIFVHRFSLSTMPIFNLWKNCAHYWTAGLLIGYFMNRPEYTGPSNPTLIWGSVAAWVAFEVGNAITHIQLRNLRKPGTKERRIPTGFLFELVSCPNYTFEIAGWAAFSALTQSIPALGFTVVGAAQMLVWARKKHYRYRKEFSTYPKSRKVLVPFIF